MIENITGAIIVSSLGITAFNLFGMATKMEPPSTPVWVGIYISLFAVCLVAFMATA